MERYDMDNQTFKGHIMVEFNFNIFQVFSQHFKVHNIVILSFKPNEIIIQTMNDLEDVEIKGFYTTTIPIESLKEYDFDCNKPKVNVMITKALIKSTSKVAAGCKSVSVVSNGFLWSQGDSSHTLIDGVLEECRPLVKSLVEVSFDLCERKRRVNSKAQFRAQVRAQVSDSEDDNDDSDNDNDNDDSLSTSEELFGKVVKKPYLHYLFTSRIDYKIHYLDDNIRYKSITVKNPTLFKNQYGLDTRIFIAENGSILFCRCHLFSEGNTIIQPYNNILVNYDADEDDCEKFDYELPSKVFKYLYKFISLIHKCKSVIMNNFEILISGYDELQEECPQVAFTVGKINFYKTVSSSVKREIENNKRKMLKRNFDKRDDWSNVKPHCHALNEHDEGLMVLPEFRLNHKYYSTHALFKDFEPIRRSELFKYDEDKDFDNPCKARKA